MARKDEILKSFLRHKLFESNDELKTTDLPSTILEALDCDNLTIKAIAIIVEGLDGTSPVTDSVLRNQVTQFLNEAL
jgi:hypothetical protein